MIFVTYETRLSYYLYGFDYSDLICCGFHYSYFDCGHYLKDFLPNEPKELNELNGDLYLNFFEAYRADLAFIWQL